MNFKNIKWGWVIAFAIAVFVAGWEFMALAVGEHIMPTWSRMIWLTSEFIWPPMAYVSQLIPVAIVLFGLWVAVHFAIGGPWRNTLFKKRRKDVDPEVREN
jgi:hypothetical protein